MNPKLLEIKDLSVFFHTPEGIVRAVEDVSFDLAPGETLGLVGESGCGKSVTSLSILGLIPAPPGQIRSKGINFENRNVMGLDPENLRRIRGNDIAMIFQEPMTSLNPVLPIGRQVAEPLMIHKHLPRSQALQEAAAWLDRVKIPAAKKRLNDYPHQLSGGMRQRVMIAMAMVCRPKLLIADEPTTALDVSIQAQIIALLKRLCKEHDTAVILITHDMGVIAEISDRVAVMYAGKLVEVGKVRDVVKNPKHPYSQGLMGSIPSLHHKSDELVQIEGTMPRLTEIPAGCAFHPRCPHCFDRCRSQRPNLLNTEPTKAACWLYSEGSGSKGV